MAGKRHIGLPTPEAIDDVWQRRAMAAAIVAVRETIGVIPPATPVARLSDVELGWLTAANLFAWIRTRAEQATAEGWDMESTLRATGNDPEPWDAGAVESILPELGELPDIDWAKPIGAWAKDDVVKFLLAALRLVNTAMIARDAGGSITTKSKSLEEMQRIAAAEAGGPLLAPGERDDPTGS